ncbi:hypothetical protein ACIBQ0_15865 [Nocardia nova]|uniref:hypothetical protein n=1 Tax=Nocardia nova TaxID=37330 RepID=UPI00378F1D68
MYYTPGWGMLATSVVGVVGVAGTLTAAWITQRYTDVRFEKDLAHQTSRFDRERRDRHYQDQRQAIAEVVAIATRTSMNGYRIATSLRDDSWDVASKISMLLGEEIADDGLGWPTAVAAAQLIIGDAAVLESLGKVHGALAQFHNKAVGLGKPESQTEQWSDDLEAASAALIRTSRALTSVTRRRFWLDDA